MRTRHAVIISFLLICLMSASFGQQVNISASLLNPSLRVFFISDFNLTGRGTSSAEIFSLNITNTSSSAHPCHLELVIRSDRYGELANGATKPFTVNAYEIRRLTNQNLFNEAKEFKLENYSIQRAGDELKNRILSTGKLPSDTYYFHFALYQEDGSGAPSTAEISIRVDNPSTLDLISPGARAGDSDPLPVFTTLPLFRWDSNLDKFRLRIAEKLPEVHQTAGPEEIINDRVRFDRTFQLDRENPTGYSSEGLEKIAATAYQYPPAGVWTLERGKTYYWQVTGLASSSGGEIEMPGEIWNFAITEPTAGSNAMQALLLSQLQTMLGERLSVLFSSSGPLAGFSPTGVFTVNGHSLTLDQLLSLIAKINSGEYVVINTSCN